MTQTRTYTMTVWAVVAIAALRVQSAAFWSALPSTRTTTTTGTTMAFVGSSNNHQHHQRQRRLPQATTTTMTTTMYIDGSFPKHFTTKTIRPLVISIPPPSPTIQQIGVMAPVRHTATTNTATKQLPHSLVSHGMPWQDSISPDYNDNNTHLTYMPFWEWQMQYMKYHLTNLKALPVVSRTGRDMSYVENNNTSNTASTMRMHTCCFCSDEYKLIRLTTLDAGHQSQVFTSLWYPSTSTDPVLGIDLLQFNHAKKHLCIVDFQPVDKNTKNNMVNSRTLHPSPSTSFESILEPIRNQYPSLQGEMTDRFYNREDSFFSKQMLLGRHSTLGQQPPPDGDDDGCSKQSSSAESMINDDLFPAYQQYVAAHVNMIQNNHHHQQQHQSRRIQRHPGSENADDNTRKISKINDETATADVVAACHQAYDTYSAARDPAHGLLAKCFGTDWADEYVYDILFPLAIKQSAEKPSCQQLQRK